jgi:hypothetical protein
VQDNAGGEVAVFVAVESQRLHKQVVGVRLFEVGWRSSFERAARTKGTAVVADAACAVEPDRSHWTTSRSQQETMAA